MQGGRLPLARRTDAQTAEIGDRAEIDIRIAVTQIHGVSTLRQKPAIGERRLLDVGPMVGRCHIGNTNSVRPAREVAIHIVQADPPISRIFVAAVIDIDARALCFLLLNGNFDVVPSRRLLHEVCLQFQCTCIIDEKNLP